MTELTIALLVTGSLIGLVIAGVGMTSGAPDKASRKPSKLVLRGRISKRTQLLLLIGVGCGILGWVITGWIILLIAVPLAVLSLPVLFSSGQGQEAISRVEALESWTRSLAGLSNGSLGLERTLVASLSSAPDVLRPQLSSLAARISARWPTQAALKAFADDLDEPTADLVVAHLTLAASMRGDGLRNALNDIAAIIGEEVRMRRQIEADRAKPRSNARIITIITIIALFMLPFTGTFTEVYTTPLGQILFAMWLGVYALLLIWIRRLMTDRPAPRILTNTRAKEATK